MEIGLVTAFLGGALALLSPCGALLLPGFFAATVTTRAGLLLHGAVYYAGLILALVPLGLGFGAIGALVSGHRDVLVAIASVVLIVLGALHALGLGFDLSRLLPGFDRLRESSGRGSGLARTFVLGAVGGIAGACAGPILGAVLVLAMGQGSLPLAALLLAVYGAGMVVPLLLLAAAWDALRARGLVRVPGRGFSVLGLHLHTTTLATGVLIIGLGILFWATNGLVTMPSLIPTAVLARWQSALSPLNDARIQAAAILVLGALALWWWRRRERRAHERADAGTPQEPETAREPGGAR